MVMHGECASGFGPWVNVCRSMSRSDKAKSETCMCLPRTSAWCSPSGALPQLFTTDVLPSIARQTATLLVSTTMTSTTYILPTLREMHFLSGGAAILLLFPAIAIFAYYMISGRCTRPPNTTHFELDETTLPHLYGDDSGHESSDDEDVDGLSHLRKALRMVDNTFNPRRSSTKRNSDDFQVFANFASASQRRRMQEAK